MEYRLTIRKERLEKKLTLREVYQKTGVTTGYIHQLEFDIKKPSLKTYLKLCKFFGYDISKLPLLTIKKGV